MHWLVGLALLTGACQAPAQPVSSSAQDAASPTRTATGEAFSIPLPAQAELSHRPSGMDFETYQVVVDGQTLVGVYVGNAPDTRAWAADTDANPSERLRPDGGQERVWRTPCSGWPSHVHVWTTPGTRDMDAANRVVRSLTITDCPSSP